MKIDDIKQIARRFNIKGAKVTKAELVRAIQQAEGNSPCFNSNSASVCGQHVCLWRSDCA